MPTLSAGEAEKAIANLNAIMDSLIETVEEETARVRAGHLRHALELEEAKGELARRYAAESERLKGSKDLLATSLPQALAALRKRNEAFQALLKTNLTVLATAHAVSEGIIRGVSGELARKRAPSTYGASGRANAPAAKASQPLALSRSL
jgi:NADH dehydrogenase/NADH:ubiquinone oxidoreductase subunit G